MTSELQDLLKAKDRFHISQFIELVILHKIVFFSITRWSHQRTTGERAARGFSLITSRSPIFLEFFPLDT